MVIFDTVEERDVDMLIMRKFSSDAAFAELFLNQCGWSGAEVISIEHSLTDPEWGESDITVIVRSNGVLCALLIENKIDAQAMPNQCERYTKRGILGIERGDYGDFRVFIVAPRMYLETNEEAKKYPNHMSYEKMLEFFECENAEFDSGMIRSAIQKKEAGYTVREVRPITDFWMELFSYTKCAEYRVEMYEAKGAKGSRSAWPRFKIPLRGAELYFKSKQGVVDLQFNGKLKEAGRLRRELNPIKDDDMHWTDTGNSISLRIKVSPMEFRNSFAYYRQSGSVDIMLRAVEKLTAFAVMLNDRGVEI